MYKPVAQVLVEEANKKPEKIVKLPFRPITVDFEDGKQTGFARNPKAASVKTEIVSDARAIKGKSLLIQLNHDTDGEFIDALFTDPDTLGVVGWRDYRISMDIKALNPPVNEESSVYIEIWQDQLRKWGFNNVKIKEAGKVYTLTTIARDILTNGKFGLKIGGRLSGDFVIDNIQITER